MEKTRKHVHPGVYQVTENNARNAPKHFSSKCRNDLWGRSTAHTTFLVERKLLTPHTSSVPLQQNPDFATVQLFKKHLKHNDININGNIYL